MSIIDMLQARADGVDQFYGSSDEALDREAIAEIERLTAENERLRPAAVKAIDILHRNLYHQREKCEDAISILRQALYPVDQQTTVKEEEGK